MPFTDFGTVRIGDTEPRTFIVRSSDRSDWQIDRWTYEGLRNDAAIEVKSVVKTRKDHAIVTACCKGTSTGDIRGIIRIVADDARLNVLEIPCVGKMVAQ